jgi:glycosyltransferase involved in cell wall biosynthesis
MDEEELNYLYNHPKVKAFVSLTHGEGYGRPLQEATMTGLPVIAPNWSGHIDFLDEEKSILLGGELTQVPKSMVWENIIIEQSQWFNTDETQVGTALNHVFENQIEVKNRAKSLMNINREKFTHTKMTELLNEVVNKYTKDIPTQVELKLPKLKKIGNNKSKPVELPKLKKVTLQKEAATV